MRRTIHMGLIMLAASFLLMGCGSHIDGAAQDYDQKIQIDPSDAEAYSNRGLAYSNRGVAYLEKGLFGLPTQEFDLAIQDFDQALQLNPSDAEAYTNRGFAYAMTGLLDQPFQGGLRPQNR